MIGAAHPIAISPASRLRASDELVRAGLTGSGMPVASAVRATLPSGPIAAAAPAKKPIPTPIIVGGVALLVVMAVIAKKRKKRRS